jgi:hypothetical protein
MIASFDLQVTFFGIWLFWGAVAKWQGEGLQNLYSAVRFCPAPPISRL